MCRRRYKFAATFVPFIFISYFPLQIYVNLTRDAFLVSREQMLKKFVYFLEILMYESLIF